MSTRGDFSLHDLFRALDAHRQGRGLSWAEVAREMNGQATVKRGHPLSSSTVKGTRFRRVMEGDGILQMLRWLNRTPESFVPGHPGPTAELPQVPRHKILRFDTRKLYAALEAERMKRGMTWMQVAKEIGFAAATLKHLAKGGRTAFPQVMHIAGWLSRPVAEFTRMADRGSY